ncbi:MAG: hypothetical protein C5B48_10075 [Candidatus Rokuibacteriota bacterium]|nr:MAG: hypothetical protein C5B48_10075 [Candidatus Rokubacteria bacterium]
MKPKALILGAVLAVLFSASAAVALAGQTKRHASADVTTVHDLSLEVVGQVTNSAPGVTPVTSIQYGYVAYLRGLPIFTGDPQSEKTALFTFYVQTTTTRVISNGPLKVISREGAMTVYRDPSANGNFSSPESFRDGTPILVAGLRQQVVVDTLSGAFSTLNLNTVISSSPFAVGSGQLQLGQPGDRFKTILNGHLNAPAPPSGYFAGYTISAGDPPGKAKHR